MPLTYVSHQVPALAAKLARPAWFDGTALALGSMSPDWPFALAGTRLETDAHNTRGVLLLCVPAATVAAVAARRLAPVAAGYLPELPGLPLRRLALLEARRPALAVTVVSALAGAWSHVAWDSFTHDGRWGSSRVRWLGSTHHVGGRPVSGAVLAQHTSSVVGGAIGLLLLSRVLRHLPDWVDEKPPGWVHQIPEDYEHAPHGLGPGLPEPVAVEPVAPTPAGRAGFWAAVGAGTAAGAVWGCSGGWDGRFNIAVLVVRTSFGTAAGAVVGALTGRRKLRRANQRTTVG